MGINKTASFGDILVINQIEYSTKPSEEKTFLTNLKNLINSIMVKCLTNQARRTKLEKKLAALQEIKYLSYNFDNDECIQLNFSIRNTCAALRRGVTMRDIVNYKNLKDSPADIDCDFVQEIRKIAVIPAGTLKTEVLAIKKEVSEAFSEVSLSDQTLPEEKSTQNPTNDVLITLSESNAYEAAGIAGKIAKLILKNEKENKQSREYRQVVFNHKTKFEEVLAELKILNEKKEAKTLDQLINNALKDFQKSFGPSQREAQLCPHFYV